MPEDSLLGVVGSDSEHEHELSFIYSGGGTLLRVMCEACGAQWRVERI